MRYRIVAVLSLFLLMPAVLKSAAGNNATIRDKPSEHKSRSLEEPDSTLASESNPFKEESLPVIFFAVHDKDESFKEVKEWGATHVHKYGMGKSIKKDQAFFDRAEKHKLKVMSDLRGRYWLKEDEPQISFNEYISHFEKHPALGFWYLVDEPDNKGFTSEELKPYYKTVQKETSNIPVAISHAWTKNWYKFGDVQDIFMYDYYPILGSTFPDNRLDKWTRFTKGVIKEGKKDNNLIIPVLQIFNWNFFSDSGQEEYQNYPVEELRYPNLEEFRYMTFASLALGAEGLSMFSYATSKKIDSQWGYKVLSPVIKEAKNLASQVENLSMRNEYSTEEENLFVASWSTESNSFIVVVNATSSSRQIQFSLDSGISNLEEYKPWGQTRKNFDLSYSEEQYTIDKMKPWEVIILKK